MKLKINVDSRIVSFAILVMSQVLIKLLGFFRDRIQVGYFGASSVERDMLVSSYTLSETIYSIASESVMMFAFLPIFSGLLKSGNQDTENKLKKFSSQIISLLAVFLLFLLLITTIFIDPFLRIIAPNYNAEQFAELKTISLLLIPQAILLSFSTFFSAMLVAKGKFKRYSTAPVLYSISLLAGSMMLEPFGISALIIATNIGALLHLAVQITPGFKFVKINFKDAEVREFLRLATPLATTAIISRNGLDILSKNLANQSGGGVLSIFELASKIFIIPHSIVALSLSQIFYTDFVGRNIFSAVKKAFAYTLFLTVPVTMIFLTLRAQIVRIAYGIEGFTWNDTRGVFGSLTIMSVSMVFFNLILILNRVFYAQKNSLIPIIGWTVSNSSFIITGYLMIYTDLLDFIYDAFKNMTFGLPTSISKGIFTVSFAYSVSNLTQFLFLYIRSKKFTDFKVSLIWKESAKIIFASLMMLPTIYGTVFLWDRIFGDILTNQTFINLFFQTGISVMSGMVVFLIMSYGLRSETLGFIIKRFGMSKLFKSNPKTL